MTEPNNSILTPDELWILRIQKQHTGIAPLTLLSNITVLSKPKAIRGRLSCTRAMQPWRIRAAQVRRHGFSRKPGQVLQKHKKANHKTTGDCQTKKKGWTLANTPKEKLDVAELSINSTDLSHRASPMYELRIEDMEFCPLAGVPSRPLPEYAPCMHNFDDQWWIHYYLMDGIVPRIPIDASWMRHITELTLKGILTSIYANYMGDVDGLRSDVLKNA
ncbi:hypothetical protein JB92DRAFT_2837849 [Gautieria morchelliformis]|nr:hypothetical protein JB92DRAFT_2837849 [Gautieria morchelliformis]